MAKTPRLPMGSEAAQLAGKQRELAVHSAQTSDVRTADDDKKQQPINLLKSHWSLLRRVADAWSSTGKVGGVATAGRKSPATVIQWLIEQNEALLKKEAEFAFTPAKEKEDAK